MTCTRRRTVRRSAEPRNRRPPCGMLPVFKECVEHLRRPGEGRLRHRDLGARHQHAGADGGLEKLSKYNGETHADLTPGEYTQLTGRAGRRGLDIEGHAVVLWQPGLDPRALSGLASTRTYPLRSASGRRTTWPSTWCDQSWRPKELLESSFAQFQADRSVVGLARQLRKAEDALEGTRREPSATAAISRSTPTCGSRSERWSRTPARRARPNAEGGRARTRAAAPRRGHRHPSRGRGAGPVVVIDGGLIPEATRHVSVC